MKTIIRGRVKQSIIGYLFLLPFLLLFFLFVVIPVFVALGNSLTDNNMIQPAKWLGITNYKLLLLDDKVFLIALKNTFIFACITAPIGYILSFFAAWMLNQIKLRNGFSFLFYSPSITSGVAITVVWMYIFSPDRYGLINNFLIQLGFINEPVLWTLDSRYILPVIIVISIWMSMGTGFLVFLAGFQNLSKELFEAAAIDGIKTRFQELRYITLPMMKPQLLFGAITSITGSFGAFDIAVQVAGIPSPNYAAHTIVAHLYDSAFIRFQMGYASAIAVILFLITFILGRIIMSMLSNKEELA